MACIERRPRCGEAETDVVPESLGDVTDKLVKIWAVISALIAIGKFVGGLEVVGGNLVIGGTTIASGLFAGGAVGLVTALATFLVVSGSARDRCNAAETPEECVAGVVVEVVDSFSSGWDDVFPWQAMHDRVDVVVKSRFWDTVEAGNALVFCTEAAWPRRSEIMRCYFFDRRVCDAANGAVTGAAVALVPAILAAALIAAALCVTVILCILGLILAALAAAAIVLAGALAGGQIAKANSENQAPTTEGGAVIATGQLVHVRGPMERRDYDDGANVIYWASSAGLHGMSMSPEPFSYCEIDDELAPDGCPTVQGPIL